VDGEAVAPEKTALEKEYDEIYARHIGRFTRPALGQKVEVKFWDGNTLEGKLIGLTSASATLEIQYGTITCPVQRVHPSMYPVLFPEQAARQVALQELSQRHAPPQPVAAAVAPTVAVAEPDGGRPPAPVGEPAGPVADPGDPGETVAGGPGEPEPDPAPARVTAAAAIRYDPAPAKTPEPLRAAITAFGQWLNVQHRRVGGRIGQRIYAKQQGHAAVLYMVVDPSFTEQTYDIRYQIAEGIWQFWGLRCETAGNVRDPRDAHLVMIDDKGRILGGSTPDDGARIWVERKKGEGAASRGA
jgi:hypothetical protein